MVDDMEVFEKREFDIGRVVNRTFQTVFDNLKTIGIISALFVGLPTLLLTFLPLLFFGGAFDFDVSDPEVLSENSAAMMAMFGTLAIISIVSVIVLIVATVVAQGAVTHAAIKDFNQEQVDMRNSLSVGLRHFWPLIGFGILSALGMAVGMLLLIIPGLILMCMWMVGVPALIVEKNRGW